jgi:hypothetical protein
LLERVASNDRLVVSPVLEGGSGWKHNAGVGERFTGLVLECDDLSDRGQYNFGNTTRRGISHIEFVEEQHADVLRVGQEGLHIAVSGHASHVGVLPEGDGVAHIAGNLIQDE